jgi:hypothetical protein
VYLCISRLIKVTIQKYINTEQTKKFTHTPSGIRTHNHSFGATEDNTRQGEETREKSVQCLTMEALYEKVLPS